MEKKRDSYSSLIENKSLKYLFFILFFIIALSLLYIFNEFFWPFLFALFIYIALRPVHDYITKYLKKRFWSSLVLVLILILLGLIPSLYLLISLSDQTYQFYIFLQQQFNSAFLNDLINNNRFYKIFFPYIDIGNANIFQHIINLLQKTSLEIFSNLTSILTFSIKLIINIFFLIIILFFLFKDGYKLDDSIYRVLPFPKDIEKDLIDKLKEVITVLLAGNLLIMILQGFVLGLGFYIFGIDMPLLWGSIAAILSLIPGIGTALVWLPAVIYLFITGDFLIATVVSIWCLLGYLILENLVKPRLFGRRLNFHPVIFFFLLIGSIQTFNLPGVIIGPLLMTLFYSFWEIYKILYEYNE
ncbi:MAG: AI-2E family transporter [Spirochaetota bacterium]|nr:AI-2E family transporter [Spirochaetota bacterium]